MEVRGSALEPETPYQGVGMKTIQKLMGHKHIATSALYSEVSEDTIRRALKPMDRRIAIAIYVVAMVAVIVGVDLLFFRNRFWERLAANIGIVLLFAAFYFRFFTHP
jgi:hypothetical protein